MVAARRAGFSLVEVIVALTLLGIGVLSVAGTALLATRFVRDSELHEEIVGAASSLLDSLSAAPDTGRGLVTAGRYDLAWQADGQRVEVQAKLQDSVLFILQAAR